MKIYKPTSPGRRNMTGIDYRNLLTTSKPEKSLTRGGKRDVGRNNAGRITVRHKGGGVKRLFRDVTFDYKKQGIPGRIATVEYDPNRSAFISLVVFRDGEKLYRLAAKNAKVGDEIILSADAEQKPGCGLPLSMIQSGTPIFNVEFKAGGGGKLARSAGQSLEVVAQEGARTLVRMPSKEVRYLPSNAWATIGTLTNEEYRFVNYGKAGRNRRRGIRPTVRGTAMNPVDHPYGGGEGVQPQGTKRPKNLWGRGTRGVKTRDKKKYSRSFIVSRRTKSKKK